MPKKTEEGTLDLSIVNRHYSYRSATMGSTFAARRAGM